MDRVSVSSTDILEVGYERESQTLEIQFVSGGVYQYFNVPSYVYDEMLSSSSKGKYFHANIKNRFQYSRVG
jgi:hypothetical protein